MVQRKIMNEVEVFESEPTYVSSLWSCLIKNRNDEACDQMRLLSGILLKTYVKKAIRGDIEVFEGVINQLKSAVLGYIELDNHCLEVQLTSIITMIAHVQWPKDWPELIGTLTQQIQSTDSDWKPVHALNRLFEVLNTLSARSHLASFSAVYAELCWSVFPVVMKSWTCSMKQVTATLGQCPVMRGICVDSCPRNLVTERLLHQSNIGSKILKLIMESALPQLVERNSCFNCFWKTFVSLIEPLSVYIRNVRNCYNLAFNTHAENSRAQQGVVTDRHQSGHQDWIFFHNDESEESDFDMSFLNGRYGGFYSTANLVLSLVRHMTCTPVILSRKYSNLVQPLMEPLLGFYLKHLVAEFPLANDAASLEKLTLAKTVLPLQCLAFASTALLANVVQRLNCSSTSPGGFFKKKMS